MSAPRNTGSYSGSIKGLHWLIVLLLIMQFTIAWTMPDVRRDTRPEGLIAWHLSVGTAILFFMLLRLLMRQFSAVPPPPDDLAVPLRLLSRITHYALYVLLIVLPVLGWINASSRGWNVKLFGLVPLPALVASGSAWGHRMGDVHGTMAWVLLAVVGLHVAGALYHQFILRDGLLRRMLPGGQA